MVIWLLRKVNNVTVVTIKMFRAKRMTNVVKVAVRMGLSQETVCFWPIKHAGWFFFTCTYSVDFSGENNRKETTWLGYPTTVFCKISVRKSKYCLEFSTT